MATMHKLNAHECALLHALKRGEKRTISDLADKLWPSKSKAKRRSWTRNSLRRPFKLGLIKKVDEGTYALTPKGKANRPEDVEFAIAAGGRKKAPKKPKAKKKVNKKPTAKKAPKAKKPAKVVAKKPTKKPAKKETTPVKKDIPIVVVGSIWRDMESKTGRIIRVLEVLPGGEKVVCQSTIGGPKTKVSVVRFAGTAKKGYKPVEETVETKPIVEHEDDDSGDGDDGDVGDDFSDGLDDASNSGSFA